MDELSPLFQEIEFHERFRGYDPDEVDAYVDRVAKAAALVRGRLTELHERVEAAESRGGSGREAEETLTRTLVLAQRTADAAIAEAREESDRMTADAATSASAILSAAEAEAQLTLRQAQAEATTALKEAQDRADRVLAEAETDRRLLLAEAEELAAGAASAERERLASEVGELQQYRAFLADDIEILERHLTEERHQLTASLSALTDLLESPEAFRSGRVPMTSGVEVDDALLEPHEAPEMETESEAVAVEIEIVEAEIVEEEEVVEAEVVEAEVVEAEVVEAEIVDVEPEPEPVAADAASTIDLVAAEAAVAAADAEADDAFARYDFQEHVDAAARDDAVDFEIDLSAPAAVAEAPRHDGSVETASPPRLVTAADLESSQAGGSRIGFVDEGPATAPVPTIQESSLFADPVDTADDPFLAQLRDAMDAEPMPVTDDDALSAFFDQEEDDGSRSWFGRRR